MNIIRITTTKTAREKNEHALYNLDFTITDGVLERVLATIYDPSTNLESDVAPIFIGTITYENEQVFCSLPGRASIAELMADFEEFMNNIQTIVASETENNK